MKFKLDENMPADLNAFLQGEGHDTSDVVREGLGGKDDVTVLQAASAEGRIFLTSDLDFADIRRFPPGSHAGIVVFRLRDQRWNTLVAPVEKLLKSEEFKVLGPGLAVVDETRVRYKRPKK